LLHFFTKKPIRCSLLFAGVFLCVDYDCWAQVSIPPDAAITPGSILQGQQKPWATPTATPQPFLPNNAAPQLQEKDQPWIELPEDDTPLKDNKTTFFIETITIEEMTLLSPEEIQPILETYQHRELTLADLETLKDKLTKLYIEKGFVNSRFIIPPQKTIDNNLILKAIETTIESIAFEKDRWYTSSSVIPRISIQPGQYFNVNPLQNSLHWINETPDLKVTAKLLPGSSSKTTRVILTATDQHPMHLVPYWDNLGRENIGLSRYGLTLNHNNLVGLGDALSVSPHFTNRSFGLTGQYNIPIGAYGTRIGVDYVYSNVALGQELEELEIQSRSHIFSPYISHPLVYTDRMSFKTKLSFDFKNLKTDILGAPFSEDRIRALRLNADFTFRDHFGQTIFNHELAWGIDALGATVKSNPLSSKAGSGSQFFRYSGDIIRLQQLPKNILMQVRGHYQFSENRLLSAEQQQIGGAFSVRGYSEGRILGDKGYYLNWETYIPIKPFPKTWRTPKTYQYLNSMIQLTTFVDFGQVFTNRQAPGEAQGDSLCGVGVGARIQINRFLTARLDLAFPLIRIYPDNNQPKLHFGLQSSLF